MTPEIRQSLLEAARLAPSADNSLPWRYRWNNEVLELWIDPARSGGFSDARYVLSDLAIGTCIENIAVQALTLGYTAAADYLPDAADPLLAARLTFNQAEEPGTADLAEAIPQRHTNRSFPWSGPVSDETKQRISAELDAIPGTSLTWIEKGPQRRTALKAIWKAESLRFRNKELHQELFSSIRFDIGRKGNCNEGLPPAALAVEAFMWPIFKQLRHWPVMRLFNLLGGMNIIGFRSAVLPCLLSPELCLLSVDNTDRPSLIQAGRALERVWLRATAEGLAMQPFAAAGILSLGFIEIENSQTAQNAAIRHLLEDVADKKQGVIFLRLGISSQPADVTSGRRSINSLKKQ